MEGSDTASFVIPEFSSDVETETETFTEHQAPSEIGGSQSHVPTFTSAI